MGRSLYDVESCFISKLLETKDIMTVKDNQIKPGYFTGDSRSAYQFIYETVLNSGEVPTVRVFERQFPNYKLESHEVDGRSIVGTDENLKFWCDELRRKVKHNSIADLVENVAEKLSTFDTDSAYDEIRKKVAYIESEITETSDVDLTKNTEDRVQVYLNRKIKKGIVGIPTGFAHLDHILKGLEDKTLTTIIAKTGVGKSWFQVIVGAFCQLHNYRVLQFVTEMSEEIMRDRYEAVLYSMCYGDFNYNKFKTGSLDMKTEKKYFKFLMEDLPEFEPLIIATATSVMGVSATIDKYKPDLVMIDSAYLMEDDQGAKDDWLRVAHITRDLKKLTKRCGKPIMINTQADKNTSKKSGPELDSIMYTQAIGQDCMPKDTMILTSSGYVAIQRLEGKEFTVFNGESYHRAFCSKAGMKETTVITYRGNEFVCSPNHKVLVYDDIKKEFTWKLAKDILAGSDFLLEQNFIVSVGHEHVLQVTSNRGSKHITIPIDATFNLGLLIGIFIGDGSIKPPNKGQVTVSCGQDVDYANMCLRLVKEQFNLDGDIITVKSATSGNDELIAVWYSVKFADWLSYFICDNNLCKTVNPDFSEMNESFRLGILSGLLQSDGSCKGQVEFVSKDLSVIQGIILLLKTFGVCTRYDFSINSHQGKHRVRVSSFDLFKIHKVSEGLTYKKDDFIRLCNTRPSGRLNKPESFIRKVCSKLKSQFDSNSNIDKIVRLSAQTGQIGQKYLESIYPMPYKFMQVEDVTTVPIKQEMWDIEVKSDDKRIIANGIVVHNSDNVLALYRDELMINDNEMGYKVLKQREGTLGKGTMNWNFDVMDFSEIYVETGSKFEEEDEEEEEADNTLDIM